VYLQQEGCVSRDYRDNAEDPTDAVSREIDEGVNDGVEDDVDVDVEENEGQELEGEGKEDYENRLDQVMADEGEELDDDVWAEEGYGAL